MMEETGNGRGLVTDSSSSYIAARKEVEQDVEKE